MSKMSCKPDNYPKGKKDDSASTEAKNIDHAIQVQYCPGEEIPEVSQTDIDKIKDVYSRLVTRIQNLNGSKENSNSSMSSSVKRLNAMLKQLNIDKKTNLDVLRSFVQGVQSLWSQYKREKKNQRKPHTSEIGKNKHTHTSTALLTNLHIPDDTSNYSTSRHTRPIVHRLERQTKGTSHNKGHTETIPLSPQSINTTQDKLPDKNSTTIVRGQKHQFHQQQCRSHEPQVNCAALSQVRNKLKESIDMINAVQSSCVPSNKTYLPPIVKNEKSHIQKYVQFNISNNDGSSQRLYKNEKLNEPDLSKFRNASEQSLKSKECQLSESSGQTDVTTVERRYKQIRTNFFSTEFLEIEPSEHVKHRKSVRKLSSNTLRKFRQEEDPIIETEPFEKEQYCNSSVVTNIIPGRSTNEIQETCPNTIPENKTITLSNKVNRIDGMTSEFDSDRTLPIVGQVHSPCLSNDVHSGSRTPKIKMDYQDKCDRWLEMNQKKQIYNLEIPSNRRNQERNFSEWPCQTKGKEIVRTNIDGREYFGSDHSYSHQTTTASDGIDSALLDTSILERKCPKHRNFQVGNNQVWCHNINKATQCEISLNCKGLGTLCHNSVQTLTDEPASKRDRLVQTEKITVISQKSQTVQKKPPRRLTSHVFVVVDIRESKVRGQFQPKTKQTFRNQKRMARLKRSVLDSKSAEISSGKSVRINSRDLDCFHEEKHAENVEQHPLTQASQLASIDKRIYQNISCTESPEYHCTNQEDDKLVCSNSTGVLLRNSKSLPSILPRCGIQEDCAKAKSALEIGPKANMFVKGKKSRLPSTLPPANDDCWPLQVCEHSSRPFRLTNEAGDKLKTAAQDNQQLDKKQCTSSPGIEEDRKSYDLSSSDESSSTLSPPVAKKKKLAFNRTKSPNHTELNCKSSHRNILTQAIEKIEKSKSEQSTYSNKSKLMGANLRNSKSEPHIPIMTEISGLFQHTRLPREHNKTGDESSSASSDDVQTYTDDFTQVDSTSCDDVSSVDTKTDDDQNIDSVSTKISVAPSGISSPDNESILHEVGTIESHVIGLNKIHQLKMPINIEGLENAEIIIYYSKKGSVINENTDLNKKELLLTETVASFIDMLKWLFQSVFMPIAEEDPRQTPSTTDVHDEAKCSSQKTESAHLFRFKAVPATYKSDDSSVTYCC